MPFIDYFFAQMLIDIIAKLINDASEVNEAEI